MVIISGKVRLEGRCRVNDIADALRAVCPCPAIRQRHICQCLPIGCSQAGRCGGIHFCDLIIHKGGLFLHCNFCRILARFCRSVLFFLIGRTISTDVLDVGRGNGLASCNIESVQPIQCRRRVARATIGGQRGRDNSQRDAIGLIFAVTIAITGCSDSVSFFSCTYGITPTVGMRLFPLGIESYVACDVKSCIRLVRSSTAIRCRVPTIKDIIRLGKTTRIAEDSDSTSVKIWAVAVHWYNAVCVPVTIVSNRISCHELFFLVLAVIHSLAITCAGNEFRTVCLCQRIATPLCNRSGQTIFSLVIRQAYTHGIFRCKCSCNLYYIAWIKANVFLGTTMFVTVNYRTAREIKRSLTCDTNTGISITSADVVGNATTCHGEHSLDSRILIDAAAFLISSIRIDQAIGHIEITTKIAYATTCISSILFDCATGHIKRYVGAETYTAAVKIATVVADCAVLQ